MGTSEFAVPILESLVSMPSIHLECVYTKQPKPAGRGGNITKTPVHFAAVKMGLQVLCPSTLKMEPAPNVDLIFVVSYGLLLPKHFLDTAKYGCINVHPSLLPRFRG
ncbi:formyltransferase family protein, partial [Candidatus Xenohaliotis californiensis]|uniref:formyltransferase family protein n=1 Tax=Candidatus Xenohaliotis californiensis TaxID=84677 RepID=UPI0030C886A5